MTWTSASLDLDAGGASRPSVRLADSCRTNAPEVGQRLDHDALHV
jgi:hypothetical protein